MGGAVGPGPRNRGNMPRATQQYLTTIVRGPKACFHWPFVGEGWEKKIFGVCERET